MPKERGFNPVQDQRKKDKAKAVKKGKAEVQDRRNEKLARKNPERIQKQIDDLKAITTNGGKLNKNEEQMLEGLEKEVKAVKKARDNLGDKAPTFSRTFHRDHESGGVLGKRRRGSDASSEEDIPEDIRRIPMPRDTPPPIPKDVMDQWWAKRRARRAAENAEAGNEKKETSAPVEAKTVYEAKPVTRDLRQEAVSAFVPTAVRAKMSKAKGQDGLMDPEEAVRLEREGYMATSGDQDQPEAPQRRTVTMEEVEDEES